MNFVQPPTFDYFLIITFSAVCDMYDNNLLHQNIFKVKAQPFS